VDDRRRRQLARNEALYRTVNEEIESLTETFAQAPASMTAVCECADESCTEEIELAIDVYEAVRADPTLFIAVPGHENLEVEVVAERHESFVVVCKDKSEGREVAIATDPRRG
jgi:hypothetical protein